MTDSMLEQAWSQGPAWGLLALIFFGAYMFARWFKPFAEKFANAAIDFVIALRISVVTIARDQSEMREAQDDIRGDIQQIKNKLGAHG